MKELLNLFLNSFTTKIINLIVAVVSSIVTSRYLGPEGRGYLAFLLTIALTLSQFFTLGIPSMNSYFISKNPQSIKKVIANSFLILIIISILVLIFLLKIFPHFYTFSLQERFIILCFVFFNLSGLFFSNILLGLMQINLVNKLEIMKNTIYISICIILVNVSVANYFHFFIANTLSFIIYGIVCLFFLINIKELYDIKNFLDLSILKNYSFFMIKNHFATFLGFAITRLNFLLIPLYTDEKTLGLYATAYSFIEIFAVFSLSINSFLYPKFCQINSDSERRNITAKILLIFFIFSLFFIIFVYFSFKPIILLMYGKDFLESFTMLVHLLPSFLLLSLISIISSYVASCHMHKIVVYSPLIAFISSLIFSWPAFSFFGIYGLIWCLNMTYFIYFSVYTIFFISRFKNEETSNISTKLMS
ncbi:MAG: oligosaccharide flippase family protein [Janthinobacterium lividum]